MSPTKVGRLQVTQDQDPGIQISASKFSVLVNEKEEVEEGEVFEEDCEKNEEDDLDASVNGSEIEGDHLEDVILAQNTKEKDKSGVKKGVKRDRRFKAQDANPKSTRPSRKKN